MGERSRLFTRASGIAALIIPLIVCVVFVSQVYAPNLGITVTKMCVDAAAPGEPIYFNGIVSNTSAYNYTLTVTVTDDHAGVVFGPEDIPYGESRPYSGSYIPTESPSTNTVTAVGTYYHALYNRSYTVQATATDTCVIEEGGDDGCTPGYWKNHLDMWAPTGYSPGDDFDITFGVDYFDPDITLEEAVNLGGGGIKKLARHGVAALISAAHPDVNYPYDVAQVIAAVQSGDSDTLATFNELGCPLE